MIQIVTHVYSKTLPQYAVFLRAHLSSIVRHDREDLPIKVSVCYTESDTAVIRVLDDFQDLLGKNLEHIRLTPGQLFRRAIGRNMAALTTPADLVWFCDVDHVFGPDCLSHLWRLWTADKTTDPPTMMYPGEILIHKDHSTGDKFWQGHLESRGCITINPRDFIPKTYHKAIGGVQIVDGAFCRDFGYLDHQPKWLTPTDGTRPFPEFRDDVKFRNQCEYRGWVDKIQLPHLYRLRHSVVTYRPAN